MKKLFVFFVFIFAFSVAGSVSADFVYQSGLIKQGSRGTQVRDLQQCLADRGVNDVNNIDGIFGPKTASAVKAFQASKGVLIDGIIGPITGPLYTLECARGLILNDQDGTGVDNGNTSVQEETTTTVIKKKRKSSGGGTGSSALTSVVNGCDQLARPFGGGSGSSGDPYRICNTEQFQNIREHLDKSFELRSNIDFTGYNFKTIGAGVLLTAQKKSDDTTYYFDADIADKIVTVSYGGSDSFDPNQDIYIVGNMSGNLAEGTFDVTQFSPGVLKFRTTSANADLIAGGGEALLSQPFSGSIDGNDYTISNISLNCNNTYSCGIFATLAGNISDLNIDDLNVTHTLGYESVKFAVSGALASYWTPNVNTGNGSIINDVHIDGGTLNLDNNNTIEGFYSAAGAVGAARGANGIGEGTGGMKFNNSSVRDFTLNVFEAYYGTIGMLTGGENYTSAENIYVQGTINAEFNTSLGYVGGIAGNISNISFTNIHADVDINIDSSLDTINGSPCCSIYWGNFGGAFAGFNNWSGDGIQLTNVISEGSVSAPWLSVVTGGSTPANGANTSKRIAAFAGSAAGLPSWATGEIDITNALALTEVDVPNYPGEDDLGFIGSSVIPGVVTCDDCYFNTTTTGQSTSYSTFGEAQNDSWFKTASNFSFLDTDIWKIEDGSYPCLIGISPSCTE